MTNIHVYAEIRGIKYEPLLCRELKTFSFDKLDRALQDVYDPEIPFNVVDLGLIYGKEIVRGAKHRVHQYVSHAEEQSTLGSLIVRFPRYTLPQLVDILLYRASAHKRLRLSQLQELRVLYGFQETHRQHAGRRQEYRLAVQ